MKKEKRVSEAIAKAGFIPEGMEIFPASSQQQMHFIERVVDRCDYYILILAGRYGSISNDGLSYTEKEFNYAKSKGIPVLAFVREKIEELPVKFIESDAAGKAALGRFVEVVKSETLVDFWSNPDELATKALAALCQARSEFEGGGWIRADHAPSAEILSEINELRKLNEQLKSKLASQSQVSIVDGVELADLEENFTIRAKIKRSGDSTTSVRFILPWRTIIAKIGANFRVPCNISGMVNPLANACIETLKLDGAPTVIVNTEDKQRILMQMEALGLMSAQIYDLKNGGKAVFHQLTDQGLRVVLTENIVKPSKE